jgi:beta-N-acetylglucosaminidase
MKLKKVFYTILMITLFYTIDVQALEGIVMGTDVRLRAGAGTTYDILGKVDMPSVYQILEENKIKANDGTNGDCDYWYKISYNNNPAFICSTFFTVTVQSGTEGGSGNFEEDLNKFPSDYKDAIRNLHRIYPNATFSVLNTGLDFQTVINNENYIAAGYYKHEARSLIQTSHDGYKSTNGILYDWNTNIWNNNISGGGSSWFAAHEDVIAYYLDPRNFLTQNSVFMFLNHGYSNNVNYTEEAINNILKGSYMSGNMTNDGTHTFARAFIDAGIESGISPYYLAARVIQEIGRSSTRSSYVNGSTGYYNYYNIDASGNDHLGNALARARNEGWDNDYKAIKGGAKFISNGYVSTGQTTLYLEKWDVVNGGNGFYSHQYMQNIEAPVSEANTLYNTYVENGLTGTSMEFLIPVYNGMTNSTSKPNKGNPNNYLNNLTINGYTISGFNKDKQDYTYNISTAVNNVEIGASKIANTSQITGTGNVKVEGNITHTITVTAGNGSQRNYTITFTKDDSKPVSVSDVVASKYVSDGTHISGIALGSNTDAIKNNLKINDKVSVRITNSSGADKNGTIATGDKIIVTSGNETKTYETIIYGDINGDGKVSALDYVSIKNSIMGTKTLSSNQKISGDVNRDGKISALDYVKVKNHIMGTSKINQ